MLNGSLEHDVDEPARRLDKFTNLAVDLTVRIGQVIYQTIHDREKVKNFFIKHQDRLLNKMKTETTMLIRRFVFLTLIVSGIFVIAACEKGGPEDIDEQVENPDETVISIPRIDFVEMSESQPQEKDLNTIWYDDFRTERDYMDGYGEIDPDMNFGLIGGSLDMGFDEGDVTGHGNRKVAFGDYPGNGAVRTGEQFEDVYWRIYVKHEHGWEGSPAKMSRATSLVSVPEWLQAMIAHVWSGADNSLTLDPARGVKDQTDIIATTKYNDFDNLYWYGAKPNSNFQISATDESGYWVLVESRAKLNTPGLSDGVNQLWIDGRLEIDRQNLNFRGSYTAHGINAVFLESYWNSGSIKTQGRWFDNFVVSTEPIGPVVCPVSPVLHKTPYYGPNTMAAWEVELSSDYNGDDVVFKSQEITGTEVVKVEQSTGTFMGSLAGKTALEVGTSYFCRVRQESSNGDLSKWSDWSRWHQGFIAGK